MDRQSINLPGVLNARQLGGYSVGDKVVKSDVLLRTADLGKASPSAKEMLSDTYHLQYIVDFRMGDELRMTADPVIPGAENIHLSVFEMEDLQGDDIDPSFIEKYKDPNVGAMERFELIYGENVINDLMYVDFMMRERGKNAYRGFFKRLLSLEDGRAILWHCTDGKDRTGLASMLILSALGADRETIIKDYMLTNEFNKERLDSVRQEVEKYGLSEEKLEAISFLSGGVIRAYMEKAIDYLDDKYGSVLGYIREELGVDDSEILVLKRRFLD